MQGLILSDLWRTAGFSVIAVSTSLNRYGRLLDIVSTLVRQRNNLDIVILEVYGGPSFVVEDIASLLSKRFNHRIVMWLHGGALPSFIARFPQWAKRVLSRADVIVTPSPYLAHAISDHGFNARIIPNVIDISDYPHRLRNKVGPRIFWMRSFHPLYNPALALRAFAQLRLKVPEASLIMAGQDKGNEAEMRRLAMQLGLNGEVRFTGFLDLHGKLLEAERSDIFLNTSHIDNMPVAIVEACALGLPVVSTTVGGIPDMLTNGETGLLVSDDDDDAVVAALHRLIDEPELASQLSTNGRKLAENSSWERVRPEWAQVFAELAIDSGT